MLKRLHFNYTHEEFECIHIKSISPLFIQAHLHLNELKSHYSFQSTTDLCTLLLELLEHRIFPVVFTNRHSLHLTESKVNTIHSQV
jgi:hypothetical protein